MIENIESVAIADGRPATARRGGLAARWCDAVRALLPARATGVAREARGAAVGGGAGGARQASEAVPNDAPVPGAAVDTLAVSAVIMLAVTVIQRAVGFSRGILFCRWLEPGALGQWELAFSFIMLAAPLAVLGLPGSFGRYVAYYQRRGQLRMFLRRTTLWTAALGLLAVTAILVAAPHVSWLVFGDAGRSHLVLFMGLALGAVIVQHFLESLLAALRLFRAVSMVQFCQSIGFATIGLSLILLWRADAQSIVAAYGLACVIASAAALAWIRRALDGTHDTAARPPAVSFWKKLLRFAVWVWIVNLLANLFGVVDRYMIVHYSSLSAAEAIYQVGQYHSSRIVPVLLVSIAELIGSMIMPYLSHDWEEGRRGRVKRTLNLAVKLIALGMLAASWIVLLAAPLLFGVAFGGKYAGGERVLPWTLAYSSLFGIAVVAQSYLWCAEKARLCSLPMLIGLVANVVLNLLLLPPLGLLGAVLATTAANLILLVLGMWLVRQAGMEMDRGTWVLAVLPVVVGLGPWATGLTVLAVAAGMAGTERLITGREKRRLTIAAVRAARWLGRRLPGGRAVRIRWGETP